MKVVAAYLLAQLGGNSSPSKKDLEKILSSVGAEADSDRIDALLSELEGKDIHEVLAAGREKMSAVPTGGGGAVGGGGGGGGGGGAAAGGGEAEEEKKEEEEEEEEDEDLGFSLFD